MSLKANPINQIPKDTERVAKAAFPKGNRYMLLRDTFGDFFNTIDFKHLFSREGKPAEDPARLALIIILQFAEQLSDERMADAVRSRIDLKYLLALPLDDPGFDSSVLCEFRARLIEGNAELLPFEKLLERFRTHKLLRERGKQRTDSTHVLAAVHALNRLSCAGQTFRHALNVLATVAPDWFLEHSKPEWVERYAKSFEVDHTIKPSKQAEREALEREVAADGLSLLNAVFADDALPWLSEVPVIQLLWRVWIQNFTWTEDAKLRFRSDSEVPLARSFINSPFDLDARLSRKRATYWVGYKAHLTETCDEDLPMLITNVETTPATTQDFDVVTSVHAKLEARALRPNQHLADMGYISASSLVEAKRDHKIDLVGPARRDQQRQAREGKGFAVEHFKIDWDKRILTCPAGQTSASWSDVNDYRGRPVIKIHFSRSDCTACPFRSDCTTDSRRTVTLQAREKHEMLVTSRAREETEEFKALYAKRAGIEGTISVGVRAHGLRRSRYFGFEKTGLQQLLTACAMNVIRVADWLAEKPRAVTRLARFEQVMLGVA